MDARDTLFQGDAAEFLARRRHSADDLGQAGRDLAQHNRAQILILSSA
jgi:hypothetical protein